MKRRRLLTLLIACVVIGVVVALVWPGEREPEYRGKKLSEWLGQYSGQFHIDAYDSDAPEAREAADAVRHIGTNALPCLLKWISYETPAWKFRLYNRMFKWPHWLGRRAMKLVTSQAEIDAHLAEIGFMILGPDARTAVPELAKLMHHYPSQPASRNAMLALSHIGDEAVPPLMAMFTNRALPAQFRCAAGQAMADVHPGRNARAAVSRIVGYVTKERDGIVAKYAVDVLGAWAIEPEVSVPALVGAIEQPDIGMDAIWSLENFGGKARSAVPALIRTLNDPDDSMRNSATSALRRIAPEVLPAAGPEPKVPSPKPDEPKK